VRRVVYVPDRLINFVVRQLPFSRRR
jgi:hypothetical protein